MFIKPVEYLIEIIFVIMYRYFNNAGIAIVGVSLTVSFLTLPLYLRADKVQEDQRKFPRASSDSSGAVFSTR